MVPQKYIILRSRYLIKSVKSWLVANFRQNKNTITKKKYRIILPNWHTLATYQVPYSLLKQSPLKHRNYWGLLTMCWMWWVQEQVPYLGCMFAIHDTEISGGKEGEGSGNFWNLPPTLQAASMMSDLGRKGVAIVWTSHIAPPVDRMWTRDVEADDVYNKKNININTCR